jgi:DNA-binding Xre family transcriptional regulator
MAGVDANKGITSQKISRLPLSGEKPSVRFNHLSVIKENPSVGGA